MMLSTKTNLITIPSAHRLRNVLLGLGVVDLLLVVGLAWSYEPFLAQSNALQYVLEPTILLLMYAGMIVAFAANPGPARQAGLYQAVQFGVITGAMEAINIGIETFGHLTGPVNILVTAPFLLGSFVLWGVSAFRTARQTGSVSSGVFAAVASAMIGMLIGIAFGLMLTYTSLPRLAEIINGSPEQLVQPG